MEKWSTLQEAVSFVNAGDLVGLGGNGLNRAPLSLVCEIARQNIGSLKLVTTAGGIEVDMLCLSGLVHSVDAAFISNETEFGLCSHYRKAVEQGKVKANEHSCYTLISGLRAAAAGIPFMPVSGLVNTQLTEACDYFSVVSDPFTGESVPVVKSFRPDISLIHADEADEMGNVWISGPLYDDVLLSRASKQLIVTVERKVSSSKFRFSKVKPQIPGFMVTALVHMPRGAQPTACSPAYGVCQKGISAYKQIENPEQLSILLQKWHISHPALGVKT